MTLVSWRKIAHCRTLGFIGGRLSTSTQFPMRRVLLAVATFALLGASCPDSSSSTGNSTSYVGTYTLITAGGSSLPASNGNGQTISSGSLSLTSSNTFTYTENRTSGVNTSSGTYSLSGVNITFTPTQTAGQTSGGATGVFSNNGNTVTVTPTGEVVLVFTKQ